MKGTDRYKISILGEFADKDLEREFLNFDMKYYSRFIGPVALIFGVIYMLFGVSDYFSIESVSSLAAVLFIRVLFLTASIGLFLAMKKINDDSTLVYLINSYELGFFISFVFIIGQYGPLGVTPFFSLMAITLGVYIIPNRIINAQIISVCFNLFFYLFYVNYIETIETIMLFKIIEYSLIFIIFGNIQAYLTNFYRRKRFADSRELLRLSITDSLTGIHNRLKFDQELNWWIEYSQRYGSPLSLVIFDIDQFKKINDNCGHLIGDVVLQNVTLTIKNVIRKTDIFARWGGDEFVILFPNTDIQQSFEITERMRNGIRNNQHDVTCSFGLTSLQKSENTESLLQRADILLYQAKEQGRDTIVYEAG